MFKRAFDIILSLIGIILSIPLWILISLVILIEDGPPIFYTQKRMGRRGKIFKAIKFRSMIKNAEKGTGPVQAAENDLRVTKVGRILRTMAMDELPQLINILRGDMSFVGPRALRPAEIESRNGKQEIRNDKAENGNEVIPLERIPGYHKRHAIRPGLTGLAQIFLPTDAPRHKKFRYDLLYIDRRTFLLDLKLILLSFWVTFRGKWESRHKKLYRT